MRNYIEIIITVILLMIAVYIFVKAVISKKNCECCSSSKKGSSCSSCSGCSGCSNYSNSEHEK